VDLCFETRRLRLQLYQPSHSPEFTHEKEPRRILFLAHVFSKRWIRGTRGWSELVFAMAVSATRESGTIIVG